LDADSLGLTGRFFEFILQSQSLFKWNHRNWLL